MPTRPVVAALAGALVAALVAGCSLAQAPLSPEGIVAAFIAESQDEARMFHMEWQGTMATNPIGPDAPVGQAVAGSINASFDFSGDDFAGTITTRTGGAVDQLGSTIGYARVGGVMFTRYPESGWQRTEGPGLPRPNFDPLQGLITADVAYEAPETVDGQDLHRLRVLDPTAALARMLFSTAPDGTELTGDSAEYAIYVDGHGVPLRAHLLFDGHIAFGASGGMTVPDADYRLAFDYQFSAWDEEFFIRSPM